MSMLKTTVLLLMLVANELLTANEVSGVDSNDESIEKYEKLLKTGKTSKSYKLAKSQKLAKFGKKLSKSGNSPNFDAKDNGSSFPTPKAWASFNCLWLAFTKAPILQHFDPECHIWIESYALGYAISDVLSQLASTTKLDGVVIKTDLG